MVKHADASHARIRLLREAARPPWLLLEVSDDEPGVDPGRSRPGHLGLTTMRQRIELLGGSLDVPSTPGSGTALQARVPVRAVRPGPPEPEEDQK